MARPAAAQDNFSDITHPDPTEVASSVVAAAVQLGEISPQEPAFRDQVGAVVREARAGAVGETVVRRRIGDVATSLLIRAGVLSFEGDGDGGGAPPGGHRSRGSRSDAEAPEGGRDDPARGAEAGAGERVRGPGDGPGRSP